jgi:prolipoprotein diacylglyceryltransferase
VRSALVAWLELHHVPGWFAPDYMVMVALASILGAAATLHMSKRDGANVALERRALLATYVAALAGGYVFEGIRSLPEVIASGSITPILRSGRAAYGGLLAGTLAAALVLRRGGASTLAFLDRAVLLCGFSYGFVRVGCFLAGCDYGTPTAGPLGVRFPADSPAAMDHAARGWVPRGAESLPVHPTQLYESFVGIAAAALAALWLLRKPRDGRAFATWIALYATGRFFVEMLRGDGSRGTYGPLSTAQLVSVGLVVAVAAAAAIHAKRAARLSLASAALVSAGILAPSAVSAAPPAGTAPAPTTTAAAGQTPPPTAPANSNLPPAPPVPQSQPYPPPQGGAAPYPYPYPYPPPQGAAPYPYPYPYPPPQGTAPYPYPYPYPYPPPQGAAPYPYPYPPPPHGAVPPGTVSVPADELPEEMRDDPQKDGNKRQLGIGLAGGGFLAPGRIAVSNGWTLDLEVMYRFGAHYRQRVEIGLEGRFLKTADVIQGGIGVPFRFVSGLGRFAELEATLVPFYTRIVFDSPYFEPANGFGARLRVGFNFPVTSFLSLGLTPLGLSIMGSGSVSTLFTYEPAIFLRIALIGPKKPVEEKPTEKPAEKPAEKAAESKDPAAK